MAAWFRITLLAVACAGWMGDAPAARAGETAVATPAAPAVALSVSSTSWRTRGRVSFPIEATLRRKLANAGLAISSDPAAPTALRIHVEYRETPGKQVALGLSGTGTDLECLLRIEHPRHGQLAEFVIHESPRYGGLITAPYIDAVIMLETNPYFYFFGEMARGIGMERQDATAALIAALAQHRTAEPASGVTAMAGQPNPADTMPAPEVLYARQAQERAIAELGRLQDSRARPLLERLAADENAEVQAAARTALAALSSP